MAEQPRREDLWTPLQQVSEDIVRIAYRLFLNREAESADVVQQKLRECDNFYRLREAFISSDEFQLAISPYLSSLRKEIRKQYYSPATHIEVNVPKDTLERLFERVRRQWKKLGEVDPYWAVISDERFRAASLEEKDLEDFYASGEQSAELIDLYAEKTGTAIPAGTCFELGCGVGRVTAFLAKRFEEVVAADISPGNLAICERYMEENSIRNVRTLLIDSPEQLSQLEEFDFFYSVITLQHNPPPVQEYFLQNILSRIRPGGACFFQTPSEFGAYHFNAEEFLSSAESLMDMHCLPQPTVLSVLQQCGMALGSFAVDDWTQKLGSYSYFAIKPPIESAAITAPKITADDVIWCYRALLGREPESKQVIEHQISTSADLRSMVSTFLDSAEYRHAHLDNRVADPRRDFPAGNEAVPPPVIVGFGPAGTEPEPIALVLKSRGQKNLLERTLRSFLRLKSASAGEAIIIGFGDAEEQAALQQEYSECRLRFLPQNVAANEVRLLEIVYANAEAEFFYCCMDDWDLIRPRLVEGFLKILRHNADITEVYAPGSTDIGSQIVSDYLFFAKDTPYRLLGDHSVPTEAPTNLAFITPGLIRRHRFGTGGRFTASGQAAPRERLAAVLLEN